jgi:hypothetical protein
MGLIGRIRGNASQTDVTEIKKEFSNILMAKEEIQRVYKYIRDFFVFTNKRIVIVKRLDIAGKKNDYRSIAYNKILRFNVETSGHFELDQALEIWCAGMPDSIKWTFSRGFDVYEFQRAIAEYVL